MRAGKLADVPIRALSLRLLPDIQKECIHLRLTEEQHERYHLGEGNIPDLKGYSGSRFLKGGVMMYLVHSEFITYSREADRSPSM